MKGFQSTTLCTVGGIVVGTAAIRILVDGSMASPIRRQMLRGAEGETVELPRDKSAAVADRVLPVAATPAEDSVPKSEALVEADDASDGAAVAGRVLPVTVTPAEDSVPKSAALVEADDASDGADIEMELPGNDPEYLKWAYERSVPVERSLATSAGAEDNREYHLQASGAEGRRTNVFDSNNDKKGFRLKLHWREGYYWQESTKETYWCMSCGPSGVCKKNQSMRLVRWFPFPRISRPVDSVFSSVCPPSPRARPIAGRRAGMTPGSSRQETSTRWLARTCASKRWAGAGAFSCRRAAITSCSNSEQFAEGTEVST